MRFATLDVGGTEQACVLVSSEIWVPLNVVEPALSGDLLVLVKRQWPLERVYDLETAAGSIASSVHGIPLSSAHYRPPFRRPAKIFGIGLNYSEHATDLGEQSPDEPASFIKGHHTIIGPDDTIRLPAHSARVTSEAELGIVFGRHVEAISPDAWLDSVFGFCAILDQTAEDILQRNPRFLTRSKNYPTFFSFGPEVVTPDEFLAGRSLEEIRVTTRVGDEVRSNVVGHMHHPPPDLVSLHSEVMPWFPGDVLSTGTPGAIQIEAGDTVVCEIDGLLPLINNVVR